MRVVAPAGPVPREPLEAGIAVLERVFGATVSLDATVSGALRYLSGTDSERAAALERALSDPGVDCVWCARGGYGTGRLLSRLPVELLRLRPVPLVGFSDVTALHLAFEAAGVSSLHGPVVTQLGRLDATSVERARALLAGEVGEGAVVLTFDESSRDTAATGLLAGGNLALLASLCGTPWAPDLAGRVVVLEDIGEPAYRVDRMLWQLRHAARLDEAAAIVVGDFTGIEDSEQPWLDALWQELADALPCPVLRGAPVGHGSRNWAFPLGISVEVDHVFRVIRLTRQPLEDRE